MAKARNLFASVVCVAALSLSACDNAETRAEGHFKNAMELLESGQTEKASLEFRNAMRLSKTSLAPRVEYGKLLMKEGDFARAAGALEEAVEIDPTHLESRKMLARIMIVANQLTTAKLHVDAGLRADPSNIEVRSLLATIELRSGNKAEARTIAEKILSEEPTQPAASQVLSSILIEEEQYGMALDLLDASIATDPQNFGLHISKLQALELSGDDAGVGKQLTAMFQIAPQNQRVAQGLIAWHLERNDLASAEDVLRARSEKFPETLSYKMAVVDFRDQNLGIDAARQELAFLAESDPKEIVYELALAEIDERDGNPDGAIERLENLLERELGTEKTKVRVHLARLLLTQGRKTEARRLIADTLSEDSTNIDALTLRGQIHLDDDNPESAISDLRSALAGSPQNPRILTVLALAHERNGSRGLAQERLALAVRASNSGVGESLRYAEFLVKDKKFALAEEVLKNAVVNSPRSVMGLSGLAKLHLSQSKWREAEDIARRIEAIGNGKESQQIAAEIRVASLSGQKRFDESIGALRQMWSEAGEKTTAMENLVRTFLLAGNAEDAASFLDGILADEPKSLRANLLLGAVFAFDGKTEEAVQAYRRVIEFHPTSETGYGALARLYTSLGQTEDANAVIKQGLSAADNAPGLLFAEASRFERAGEFESAIAIYEQLYEANKISDVLANNYASLLSDYRDDPESLETAYNVAKRLRSSTNPAFQDTYGWILFKRGEHERALQPLKSAAEGIPNNPVVHFHLGMLYRVLGKTDEAKSTLALAVELFGESSLPQAALAKSVLAEFGEN